MFKPILATSVLLLAFTAEAQVVPDPLGTTIELPTVYPETWIIAQDAAFFHPNDGKFIILDAGLDDHHARYKGMFNGSFVAQLVVAESRPEMYVVETFHSRGHRGVRTDVLTVYNKRTIAPVDEVVLPPKRALTLPIKYALQLVDEERLALVFNLTPATSVTVVDLERREFLAEISIPSCSMVFPTGRRGFSSLCANGTLLTVHLNERGETASTERSATFFDPLADALFEKPAMHGQLAHFPTFLGNLVTIDLSGNSPIIAAPWNLVDEAGQGWRPGGTQPAEADSAGRLYVLMHPEGAEGTHKDPGSEVWVFDPAERKRIARIALRLPAISIELTRGESPLLVSTNINMNLDVYDARDGSFQRTLSDFGQETPLVLQRAR